MSNTTVYPFGTEGTLPASIGVINDTITGGADKALSAEQGVVLNNRLPGGINAYAVSIDTALNGTTNKWDSISQGSPVVSKMVKVFPGCNYRISADNGTAIYAVLTTDAHASNTSASYATGFTGRQTLAEGNTIDIVLPSDSDAQYINFRADNVSGSPYEPSIVRLSDILSKQDVVDNLNSTSPNAPLSANQGRLLKESIGETGYMETVDLDNEITLDDFWVGRTQYPSQWYGSAGYKTKVIEVPTGATKVTIVTDYTGSLHPIVPIFLMASYTPPTADLDPVDFADGYTERLLLSNPATTTIDLPDDCTYIAIGYYDAVGLIYYTYQVTFMVGTTVSEALEEMRQEISDLRSTVLAGGEVTYFDNFQISPMLTGDKSRPLVYEGDTKSSGNFLCNAVVYPDGTIIAARSGVGLVKIDDNGETTLLSLPGSTDMRCLWMDEDLTVYASPFNAADADGAATDIGNGLYRMPYGTNTFTKVLSLSAGNAIWTMCRDRSGYLYCGEYSIVNNVPVIYRSSDNGANWASVINFNTVGLTSNGRHIHSVIYNKYNDKLYAIVGEVNTIFRSGDHGANWADLDVQFYDKGSSMFATPHGILVGSDSAYWCDLDLLLPDDSSHKKVSRIWADTVFGIRQSDQTGFLYAFCKIDSSVKSSSYMPQIDLTDDAEVAAYLASHTTGPWRNYYDSMKDYYPDDAMRPTHFAILISRDEGKTWEVLYAGETGAINADGIWTIGYFRNGECLCGHIRSTSSSSRDFVNPVIISEGRHKYTNGKISVEGDIFAKTLSSVNIDAL